MAKFSSKLLKKLFEVIEVSKIDSFIEAVLIIAMITNRALISTAEA